MRAVGSLDRRRMREAHLDMILGVVAALPLWLAIPRCLLIPGKPHLPARPRAILGDSAGYTGEPALTPVEE